MAIEGRNLNPGRKKHRKLRTQFCPFSSQQISFHAPCIGAEILWESSLSLKDARFFRDHRALNTPGDFELGITPQHTALVLGW